MSLAAKTVGERAVADGTGGASAPVNLPPKRLLVARPDRRLEPEPR